VSTGIEGTIRGFVPASASAATASSDGIIGGSPLRWRPFPSIDDADYYYLGFSPDERWFAYTSPVEGGGKAEPFIYLLSVDDEHLTAPLPRELEPNRDWTGAWISNDLIMVQYVSIPVVVDLERPGSGTVVVQGYDIINPFSGELATHLVEDLPYVDPGRLVYFSPDLTRAVYFSYDYNEVPNSILLWDMESETILWSRPFSSVSGNEERVLGSGGLDQTAFWAPDSSAFIFTTEEEGTDNESRFSSYLVDRNGSGERLLLSEPNLLHPPDPDQWVPVSVVMEDGGRWSPDGRFIYYSLSEGSYIYDLELDEVTEICTFDSAYAAWSPDGDSIAYVGMVHEDYHLLLFDMASGAVSSLGEMADIIGIEWLKDEAWLAVPE